MEDGVDRQTESSVKDFGGGDSSRAKRFFPFPIEALTEIRFFYMMRKRRDVWGMWECQLTKRAILEDNHQGKEKKVFLRWS
jgi:hypothetical protein